MKSSENGKETWKLTRSSFISSLFSIYFDIIFAKVFTL